VLIALAAAAPVKLASVGFVQLNLTEQLAGVYADTFANKLQACGGIDVLTSKDIAAVLGIERQKALLGCSEESTTCSAEIAGALGVDGVIRGDVARVGSAYQINIRILSAKNGQSIAVFSHQANSEQELLAGIAQAAKAAAPKVRVAFGGTGSGCVEASGPGLPRWAALIPGALGVVTLAIGTGFWASAGIKYATLRNSTTDLALAVQQRDQGAQQQTVGIALVATGAALAAIAVVWYALTGEAAPAVSSLFSPSGGAWAGAWP
jgi:hypothetical protein